LSLCTLFSYPIEHRVHPLRHLRKSPFHYDRSHDGLRGKSPVEALQEVNPACHPCRIPREKMSSSCLSSSLDGRVTLLGGGSEVFGYYTRLLTLKQNYCIMQKTLSTRHAEEIPQGHRRGKSRLLPHGDGDESLGFKDRGWTVLSLCVLLFSIPLDSKTALAKGVMRSETWGQKIAELGERMKE